MASLPVSTSGLSSAGMAVAGAHGADRHLVREGLLRKVKSGHDRYAALWGEDTVNGLPARLEFYMDKKAFDKRKTPKRVLPITEIMAVASSRTSESDDHSSGSPPSSPSSLTLPASLPSSKSEERLYHGFTLILKADGGDSNVPLACTDKKAYYQWTSLLRDFVTGIPATAVKQLGYVDYVWHNVKLCKSDLGQKIRRKNSFVDGPCSFAFNSVSIILIRPQQMQPFFYCQISNVRRCGVKDNRMFIYCGRHAQYGEGRVYLETPDAAMAETMRTALFNEMVYGVDKQAPSGVSTSPYSHGLSGSFGPGSSRSPSPGSFSSCTPPQRAVLARQQSDRTAYGSHGSHSGACQSWKISPTSGKATPVVSGAYPASSNMHPPQPSSVYQNMPGRSQSGAEAIGFHRSLSSPVTITAGRNACATAAGAGSSLQPGLASKAKPMSAPSAAAAPDVRHQPGSYSPTAPPPLPEKSSSRDYRPGERKTSAPGAMEAAGGPREAGATRGASATLPSSSSLASTVEYRPRADAVSGAAWMSPLIRQSSRAAADLARQTSVPTRRRNCSEMSQETIGSEASMPLHYPDPRVQVREKLAGRKLERHRSSSLSDIEIINFADARSTLGLSDYSMLDGASVFTASARGSTTSEVTLASGERASQATFPSVEARLNSDTVRNKRQAQLEQARKLSDEGKSLPVVQHRDEDDEEDAYVPLQSFVVPPQGISRPQFRSNTIASGSSAELVSPVLPEASVQTKGSRSQTMQPIAARNVMADDYETMVLKPKPKAGQDSTGRSQPTFLLASTPSVDVSPVTARKPTLERSSNKVDDQYVEVTLRKEQPPPLPKKQRRISAGEQTLNATERPEVAIAVATEAATRSLASIEATTLPTSLATATSAEAPASGVCSREASVDSVSSDSPATAGSTELTNHMQFLKQRSQGSPSMESSSIPSSSGSSLAGRSASVSSHSGCSHDACVSCAQRLSSSSSSDPATPSKRLSTRLDYSGLASVSSTKEKFETLHRQHSASGSSITKMHSGSLSGNAAAELRRGNSFDSQVRSGESLQPRSRYSSVSSASGNSASSHHESTIIAENQDFETSSGGTRFIAAANSTSSGPIPIGSRHASAGSHGSNSGNALYEDSTMSWTAPQPSMGRSSAEVFDLEITGPSPASASASVALPTRSPYENAMVRFPVNGTTPTRDQQTLRQGRYFESEEASVDSGFGSRLAKSKGARRQGQADAAEDEDEDEDEEDSKIHYQVLSFDPTNTAKSPVRPVVTPTSTVYQMINPEKTKALQDALSKQTSERDERKQD